MGLKPRTPANPPATPAVAGSPLPRRGLVIGAGAAGAALVAARLLPGAASPEAAAVAVAKSPLDTSGGYRETAHVRRYYETARS